MSSDGKLTAEAAIYIAEHLKNSDYEVLFDHGSSLEEIPLGVKVGHIVSWSGDKRGSQLSHLDIAIVEKGFSRKAIALIEIEEKDDRPKTFLSDALAMLIGKSISFGGKSLQIGNWTTLLVLGKRTIEQESKSSHEDRMVYLRRKIAELRVSLQTSNSKIGKVMIRTFTDGSDLQQKLLREFAHLKKE